MDMSRFFVLNSVLKTWKHLAVPRNLLKAYPIVVAKTSFPWLPNFQVREIECKFLKGSRICSKNPELQTIEGSKNHEQNQVNPRKTTLGSKNGEFRKIILRKLGIDSTVSGMLTAWIKSISFTWGNMHNLLHNYA